MTAAMADIEPIRKIIGRRLMSDKWVKEGQKQLDDMLITLHQAGFITLITEDGKVWEVPQSDTQA